MTLIAVRSDGARLLDIGDGMGVVESKGKRWPPTPIQVILAHGGWRNPPAESGQAVTEEYVEALRDFALQPKEGA